MVEVIPGILDVYLIALQRRGYPAYMYVRSAESVPWYDGNCSNQRYCHKGVFGDALVNEILSPMNPYPDPRSLLVIDNAAIHDHLEVHDLCKEYGIKPVFLPPHSIYPKNIFEVLMEYALPTKPTYSLRR